MEFGVTKEDLRQFGLVLMNDIRKIMETKSSPEAKVKTEKNEFEPEWLKSHMLKKVLDISPKTIQRLRISGKVRYRKILGSYYYNKTDLLNLFNEERVGNDSR
jgi:hypothetical protein